MKSGPLGGDQQIGAMLANGELDLIVFLHDPLTAQPHEPDVSVLLRLGDIQKIPLATNVSSATIMLESLKNKHFPSIPKVKNILLIDLATPIPNRRQLCKQFRRTAFCCITSLCLIRIKMKLI